MDVLRLLPLVILCLATPIVLSKTNNIDQNNLCVPNPCQNGGVCTAVNGSTVFCDCLQGFTGKQCELKTTQCKNNPCKHGICQLGQNNSPLCFCVPGYTGKFCENNNNECASQPCRNGGTCIDEVNDFRCVCKAGSFGRHCEMLIEHIEEFVRRCDEGLCWRNSSIQVNSSWGYGDNICSTQHSCFGGQNDSATDTWDRLIDVQLRPLQIQAGDSLNFTADSEMSSSIEGFQLYRAFDGDANGFRTCNETDGEPVTQESQYSVLVGGDILKPGLKYFYVNVDTIFRCEFGLRLNVSVKENHCANSSAVGKADLCSNRGQCHTNFSLSDYRCKCCDGFRGDYCEKLDHCFSKPCKNNAQCKNTDNGAVNGEEYVCVCQPGYEGRDCSIVTDMCTSNPCAIGAQCMPKINDFTCVCPLGFTGKTCAVNINECDSNPCQHGGTCRDALNSYSCLCKPGFTGSVCEVNINECASSPCKHGTCFDEVNTYRCQCQPGYAGINCAFNLNECLDKPCKNGGYCVDEVNSYHCDCGRGYKGKHCEVDVDLCKEADMCSNAASCTDKGNTVECVCKPGFTGANCAVNINDCASAPCLNGATCVDRENRVECHCQLGFSGKFCQDFVQTTDTPAVVTQRKPVRRLLTLKLFSECQILQDASVVADIKKNVASAMSRACNCSFTEQHLREESFVLQCYDSISAEVGMDIKAVGVNSKERLVCMFADYLKQQRNVIDLGHNIFAVKVISDTSSCGPDVEVPVSTREGDEMSQGNIAVTVSAVIAAVGLIAAAIVLCFKCRKARPPIKKQKSGREDEMIDNLSVDLMAAIAPTPKSMYRTSGGYHNTAYSTGRFNPENPVKSRKI